MLNKRIITLLALGLFSTPLFAQSAMDIEWVSNTTILYALYFLIVVLVVLVFLLFKTLNHLTNYFNKDDAPETRRSFWEQIFQVKAISTDKDMMLDHEYDGIRELDNPPPPWFMFLFYGTILFGAIYFYRFSIAGTGPTQVEEYQAEVTAAEEAKKAAMATNVDAGPAITATTVAFSTEASALTSGKQLFNANCKVCHGDAGGMKGVGPNLTDEYWIHGGSPSDIFTTIENGVSGKMTPWKGILTGKQIQDVMSYFNSLDYIAEDAGGQPPQGEKYVPSEEPAEEGGDEGAEENNDDNAAEEGSEEAASEN